jgi:hypothetical protein
MKKYYCIDCGKKILRENIRCSCCHFKFIKGINNPNYKGGKPKCLDCGKEIGYGHYRRIECGYKFNTGANNPNYKGGKPKCIDCGKMLHSLSSSRCHSCYFNFVREKNQNIVKCSKNNSFSNCIDCNKKTNNYNAKRCWACYVKFNRGSRHHLFGKKPNHGNFIKYNKIWFRSSWEANFAKWLDLSGIKWEYEPKAFELKIKGKNTTYTLDFYLPKFDCWIEIKGWWRDDAKEKFYTFLKFYKNINIKLFQLTELKKIGFNF